MLIDHKMDTAKLADIMTKRATEEQAKKMRDLLCLHHKGFETDQVPQSVWNLLVDVAFLEGAE